MSEAAAVKPILYTIGHSNHAMPEFLDLLNKFGVEVVADVRSQPYSRIHTQFNLESFAEALEGNGVRYVFLGRELGARRAERECYRDHRARYDLIARLPAFLEGIAQVRRLSASHRVCLLCAEKDPLICHRTVLVGRHLRKVEFDIRHILAAGSLETTEEIEARLLSAVGLPATHLFLSRAELVEQAYDLQAERLAYTASDPHSVPVPNQAGSPESS